MGDGSWQMETEPIKKVQMAHGCGSASLSHYKTATCLKLEMPYSALGTQQQHQSDYEL
jgi:hypothetical protein